jgi:prepilin-type N-terminal cleavage/methylation domain-containing protein
MTKEYQNKGFTLIEVIIVVILLATIITLSLSYNWGKAVDKAKVDKTIAVIRKLTFAINTYNEDTGYYPSSAKQLWKNDLDVMGWKGAYVKPPYLDPTYDYFPKMPYDGKGYIECKDGEYVAFKMETKKVFCQELDKRIDDGNITKGRVYWDNKNKVCYYLFDKGSHISCK